MLRAPPGGGKSTALRFLRQSIAENAPIVFRDDATDFTAPLSALCIATTSEDTQQCLGTYRLVDWQPDEWLEYLSLAHREQCKSVMRRMCSTSDAVALEGSPELCRIALDELAIDESVVSPVVALERALHRMLSISERPVAEGHAYSAVTRKRPVEMPLPLRDAVVRLYRHRVVKVILAATKIVSCARNANEVEPLLAVYLPQDLVRAVADRVAGDHAAVRAITSLLERDDRQADASVVRILFAIDADWHPHSLAGRLVRNADLSAARWSHANLLEADLTGSDFTEAELIEATLQRAVIAGVRFDRANLSHAKLSYVSASDASFECADLTNAQANGGRFWHPSVRSAKADRINLWQAELDNADLARASFRNAKFEHAKFYRNAVDDTDFTDADFTGAHIVDVDFRNAILDGACFKRARLHHCICEDLAMESPDFTQADLNGTLFTGSQMPHAKMAGARLVNAGLADIDWPGADLREANFHGASFHMGSSRSGLVGSVLASEGTRTGFYTDDFNDQDFKPPEEIRKANLRGADLRGANVFQTDFYLVDLRDAKYSDEQREHFVKCGAILNR